MKQLQRHRKLQSQGRSQLQAGMWTKTPGLKSASYTSWWMEILSVQKQGHKYWLFIYPGRTRLMIWKLKYSPMLAYIEKPPFKKNQWTHFSKRLIRTDKLAQQADVYEKWKVIKRAVFSENRDIFLCIWKTFLQSPKFIYPDNFPRTTWNETICRRRTNSLKYWIEQVLNVWVAASNLVIQWK